MTTALTGWRKLRTPISTAEGDPEAAVRARELAQQLLAAEHAKQAKTAEVAERMRDLRNRNHFAELIAGQMQKKQ